MTRARSRIGVAILAIALGATACAPLATESDGSASPRPTAAHGAGGHVVGAVGDIVCSQDPYPPDRPDDCQYDDTADLIDGTGLTAVLALGDTQYDTGRYEDFLRYYDPSWGRALSITRPVPGNHEYEQGPDSRPRGYFRYFGKGVKGPDGLGYYSFDVPDGCTKGEGVCWHVIALSSMLCFTGGGCGPATDPANPGTGNRMYAWLRADLAAHPNDEYRCTIAYWHHPLYSFSSSSGATGTVRPLWELLYAAGADIVLNGHSHNYQRWRPQDPEGHTDREHGIREWVLGTGGKSKYDLESGERPPQLAAAQDSAFGILRLTLRRAGYTWGWVNAPGQPSDFADTRTTAAACV